MIPSELHLENEILDSIRTEEIFQEIDQIFHGCRRVQKLVISKLLTAKILAELPDFVEKGRLWQYEFWDENIYQDYLRSGVIPTARQVSIELGRNEASASRTFNHFLQKLRAWVI